MKSLFKILVFIPFQLFYIQTFSQSNAIKISAAQYAIEKANDCNEGLKALSTVTQDGRTQPLYLYYMAKAYDCLTKYDSAIYFYNKYLEFMPNDASLIARVGELIYKKSKSEAINVYDKYYDELLGLSGKWQYTTVKDYTYEININAIRSLDYRGSWFYLVINYDFFGEYTKPNSNYKLYSLDYDKFSQLTYLKHHHTNKIICFISERLIKYNHEHNDSRYMDTLANTIKLEAFEDEELTNMIGDYEIYNFGDCSNGEIHQSSSDKSAFKINMKWNETYNEIYIYMSNIQIKNNCEYTIDNSNLIKVLTLKKIPN